MSEPPPDYNKGKNQFAPYGQEGMSAQAYGQMSPHQQYGPGQMAPHPQYGQPFQPMMHQQQSNTTVIVNQPGTMQNDRILGARDGHRDWSSGMCACFDDVGKCLWAMWCPSCVLADISARLGECVCVTCCIPGGLATVRTRVRTLGGIRGSIFQDYLATECCQPCVMCQIHRELDYMGL